MYLSCGKWTCNWCIHSFHRNSFDYCLYFGIHACLPYKKYIYLFSLVYFDEQFPEYFVQTIIEWTRKYFEIRNYWAQANSMHFWEQLETSSFMLTHRLVKSFTHNSLKLDEVMTKLVSWKPKKKSKQKPKNPKNRHKQFYIKFCF